MWGCIGGRIRAAMLVGSSLTVCEGVSDTMLNKSYRHMFPHCMWGCIEAYNRTGMAAAVPSLYVRVYRVKNTVFFLWDGSLTVCEGVSFFNGFCAFNDNVPSLYVRVYLCSVFQVLGTCCSLTVCEGVSPKVGLTRWKNVFPHCMWGCIEYIKSLTWETSVPSLYVRVYRLLWKAYTETSCSLTVCEGVSPVWHTIKIPIMFPHCMWGCIEKNFKPVLTTWVPSLYVRVYRHI